MVKIHVNEKQKVVVAVLEDCRLDAYNQLERSIPFDYFPDSLLSDETSDMPETIKAVARCHPDDKFDVEVGKKIAVDKVMVKYTNSYNKALTRVQTKIGKLVNQIENLKK